MSKPAKKEQSATAKPQTPAPGQPVQTEPPTDPRARRRAARNATLGELMNYRANLQSELDRAPDWRQSTDWHTGRVDQIHLTTRQIQALEDDQCADDRAPEQPPVPQAVDDAPAGAPAPPVTFEQVWSNCPADPEDEYLEVGSDGSFQVRRGDEVTPLDIPGVVELIVQGCLSESKELWPQFAAYLPSLYPDAAPRWTPLEVDPATLERARAYAAENGCTLDGFLADALDLAAGNARPSPSPARPAAPPVTPDPAGSVTIPITFNAVAHGLLVAMAAYDERPDLESAIKASVAGTIAAFCTGMKEPAIEELVHTGKVDFKREAAE